jgi:putative membrane protein
MEQSMGKVAQKNSNNDRVKDFAAKMIKDHGEADKQLERIAKANGVSLVAPDASKRTPEEVADARNKMAMEKQLKDEKGTMFDHDYLKMMVDGHKDALEMLTNATPSDPGLKDFVSSLVPVVRQHERLASELSSPGLGRRPRAQ